jgi:hypothetical protein
VDPSCKTSGDKFNIWAGFHAETLPEDVPVDMELIEPMLDLLKNVWAAGDEQVYKALLGFFSDMVRKPEVLIRQALVIIGDQGIGKDFLISFIRRFVIGEHLTLNLTGIKDVVCQFNSGLESKKLCVVNELASTKREFKASFDCVKPLITDDALQIQRKGIDKYTVNNIASWIFFSNHRDVFHLEKGDRRYVCLEAANIYKGNTAHFNKLADQCFNDKAGQHFFTYLMRLSDNDTIPLSEIKDTALKEEMIDRSKPSSGVWMDEVLDMESKDDKSFVSSADLYSNYVGWCESAGEHSTARRSFSVFLKNAGLLVARNGNVRGFMVNMVDISDTNEEVVAV